MTAPLKVLYIGGTGRTGSTLLDKLLGQVPGVFAGGELAFLWKQGICSGGRCSCGAAIVDCPVWGRALTTAFGPDGVDAAEMVRLRTGAQSTHLPLMVVPAARRWLLRRLGPFPERTEALYRAIASTTGSRLIVDSSKEPHYSWILRSRPGLDVRFLHLVRDPRAIAHSWQRRRREPGLAGDAQMEQRTPVVSALYHNVSNVASDLLWANRTGRYLRLRYEDLLSDPQGAVEQIEALVDEPLPLDGILSGSTAVLGQQHVAWGNPNRFESGSIELRPDTEWETAMPAWDKRLVAACTFPLMRRYGYPLGSPRTALREPSPHGAAEAGP